MLGVTGRWDGVRERLGRLQDAHAAGNTGEVFGADGHGFEVLPPLGEAALAQAEDQFGVRLPEDYRTFLAAVSAGGAGPFYGLFPLARTTSGAWGWRGDGAELTLLTDLALTFDPGDVSALLAELDKLEPDVQDEAAYEDWLDRREAVLWDDARTRGAVCLCHEGCAYRDWLVVAGPARGQIWGDNRVDDVDLAPRHAEDGTVYTFSRWYLDWLDEAERIALASHRRT